MAERLWKNGGRIYANEAFPVVLFAKITAAADVDANGYTVSNGGEVVTSVAKTAEGKARVTLSDSYFELLGVCGMVSRTDCDMLYDSEDVNGATPYVDVIFQDAGTDTDPDSATIFLIIFLKNTPN
jgi:hypothetical protein